MRAFVTGATGFIGAAVVRELLARNVDVVALARPNSDRSNLVGLDIEVQEGDLLEPHSYQSVLDRVDAVFHLGADYRLWVPDPARLYRTNVDGTVNVVQSAWRAGVTRIVYTSSVATLGLNADRTASDESTPSSLNDMVGHYKRSKFLAEESVRELARQGAPVVIVNPSTPLGPRDIKPTPTGRVILEAARGRLPAFVDTGLNIVHVDDVARGHWCAYERGVVGERYVLGGEDRTLRDILTAVAKHVGRKPPSVRLPHLSVLPVAYVAEAWARLVRSAKEPLATVDGIQMAKHHMYFSSRRAVDELGYTHRASTEAIQAAIDWFKLAAYC